MVNSSSDTDLSYCTLPEFLPHDDAIPSTFEKCSRGQLRSFCIEINLFLELCIDSDLVFFMPINRYELHYYYVQIQIHFILTWLTSHLQSHVVCMFNCDQGLSNKLQTLQNRAARIVTRTRYSGAHYETILKKLQLAAYETHSPS